MPCTHCESEANEYCDLDTMYPCTPCSNNRELQDGKLVRKSRVCVRAHASEPAIDTQEAVPPPRKRYPWSRPSPPPRKRYPWSRPSPPPTSISPPPPPPPPTPPPPPPPSPPTPPQQHLDHVPTEPSRAQQAQRWEESLPRRKRWIRNEDFRSYAQYMEEVYGISRPRHYTTFRPEHVGPHGRRDQEDALEWARRSYPRGEPLYLLPDPPIRRSPSSSYEPEMPSQDVIVDSSRVWDTTSGEWLYRDVNYHAAPEDLVPADDEQAAEGITLIEQLAPAENVQAAEGIALIERIMSIRLIWIWIAIILCIGMVIFAWYRGTGSG
ncbi:hypothetical protein TI39_contig4149g00023 [Zymoseptoria brevis]|uniref:Uncharacterized protein n=1 Tax=Zymoseptoria brevis TaxID=1047168 RepID=A0A0F4GC20_9PEZI|nr:hypothetical protein TI39_contig4149g00023 [Zymoseptoria brevis]